MLYSTLGGLLNRATEEDTRSAFEGNVDDW